MQNNTITSDKCQQAGNFAGNVGSNQHPTAGSRHRAKWHFVSLVLLLAMMPGFIQQVFAQTQTFSIPGTYSGVNGFIAPSGVTNITVEVWGGGGAGGGGNTVAAAGGGGGGYKKVTAVTVVPGTQYTIVVGAGGVGAATAGPAGGLSSGVFGATTVSATGGTGGAGGNTPVGTGGTGGTGGFTGGNGAPGVNFGHGGGGGSSAGPGAGAGINGNTSSSGTGGTAVTGGGAGGNGGSPGSTGGIPGGGGGGGMAIGSVSGGSGGNGKVVITYAPTITDFSPIGACSGSTPLVTINGNYFTGVTAVKFNGVAASSFTFINATQITATPPAGATTGKIAVTTPAGSGSSSSDFIVSSPVATVTGQTPISCYGKNDATITVSASGGISPYTFTVAEPTWLPETDINLHTRVFTGLYPGIPYRVRVQDHIGCLSQ